MYFLGFRLGKFSSIYGIDTPVVGTQLSIMASNISSFRGVIQSVDLEVFVSLHHHYNNLNF